MKIAVEDLDYQFHSSDTYYKIFLKLRENHNSNKMNDQFKKKNEFFDLSLKQ